MRSGLFSVALFALGVACAPTAPAALKRSSDQKAFSFPLSDGFPNVAPGSVALQSIQKQARGTLPDGPLPTHIADLTAVIFQLIAFNEIFEVAYFSSLVNNITANVPGYEIGSPAALRVVSNALTAVIAQEELHALGANGILQAAGRKTIEPCEYIFPVDNFDDAIAFASVFTDIVLGTLQEVLTNFAIDGDGPNFVGLIGSVIGQEGEQNGFYRTIGQPTQIPSSQPFLTAAAGQFALSALHQMVIVPGSCPDTIAVPTFSALKVETSNIGPRTEAVQFSFHTNGTDPDIEELSLVYINGQNLPVVERPADVRISNGLVQFSAPFPYQKYQMDGLTIAAVTTSAGPFANATDVASDTLYGPGLIEVA
ncbi:putative Sexual development protein [Seiridium unicorne]|uniref:Sexual development protein n=1 Tax=Seiridium unicorne TaxID=138068 RepID=A0ABR2UNE0_9PEZI